MPKTTLLLPFLLLLVSCQPGSKKDAPGNAPAEPPVAPAKDFGPTAAKLAKELIIVDGHIDVPYRLNKSKNSDGTLSEDIAGKTEKGEFDYPRAKEGGLDAPFMSIYVPSSYQKSGGAKAHADGLIDMVEGFVKKNPGKFALATSPSEVRANFAKGLVSLPLGIENGAALEGNLENIAHFQSRGVRYITLTHATDNKICDSSYDTTRTWKGLSPFGREVISEMNRVGIMVDISHVSDDAFYQALEVAEAPMIASHSSARRFTVDFERNMSDEMIRALAMADGVIMINFGSTFLSDESRRYWFDRLGAAVTDYRYQNKLDAEADKDKLKEFSRKWKQENPPTFATVDTVADHIDYVVGLVGMDHVGFGSDFDGVGDSLPTGLKDASDYPNLIRVLLERGYDKAAIKKMASGNVFRVWKTVLERAQINK